MPPRTAPLTATAPLRRSGFPQRRSGVAAATAQPATVTTPHRGRDTGPGAATRAAVYARDGWRCVCCGTPVKNRPHSIGHRVRRSHGADNSLPNLITLLGWGNGLTGRNDHHYRIDQRRDPADEDNGYSLRSWQDPAEVPVLLYGPDGPGQRLWLTQDGRYAATPPAERRNR